LKLGLVRPPMHGLKDVGLESFCQSYISCRVTQLIGERSRAYSPGVIPGYDPGECVGGACRCLLPCGLERSGKKIDPSEWVRGAGEV
jgi:hypothetical protein